MSVFNDPECRNCIVLPLCMGGCTYCRLNQKKFCIPEKYFLDKYIKKLYIQIIAYLFNPLSEISQLHAQIISQKPSFDRVADFLAMPD